MLYPKDLAVIKTNPTLSGAQKHNKSVIKKKQSVSVQNTTKRYEEKTLK